MLVTMLTHIGGHRNGEEWPPIGGTVDVPDHEAADLIANRYAREAIDAPTSPEPGPDTGTESDEAPSGAEGDENAATDGEPPAEATAPVKRKGRPRKSAPGYA